MGVCYVKESLTLPTLKDKEAYSLTGFKGAYTKLFFFFKVDILSQNNFIQLDQRNDAASKIMKKFSWKIGGVQAWANDDNFSKNIY